MIHPKALALQRTGRCEPQQTAELTPRAAAAKNPILTGYLHICAAQMRVLQRSRCPAAALEVNTRESTTRLLASLPHCC